MTIDDQLRGIARHADQHQQVITSEEIVLRASSQRTGSFTSRSRFNQRRNAVNHMPVPFTEEELIMTDLETANHTGEHRNGPKRVVLAALLATAAAAVIVIALVAIRNDDPESPADQPSPTVTVRPTPPPQALFGTPGEQLVPGTYFVDKVDGTPTARIFVTVGAGWTADDGWSVGKEDLGLTFSRPDRVFLDACHPSDGFHPGPMITLDGLVAALTEQGGWAEVTAPADISVDGYVGKAFQRTTPADFSDCSSVSGGTIMFPSWENDGKFGLFVPFRG